MIATASHNSSGRVVHVLVSCYLQLSATTVRPVAARCRPSNKRRLHGPFRPCPRHRAVSTTKNLAVANRSHSASHKSPSVEYHRNKHFGRWVRPTQYAPPASNPDLWSFLTLKLVCETHLRWGTFLPNLGTLLGSRIIRYVRDGRTDRQTDRQKQRLLPLPHTVGT